MSNSLLHDFLRSKSVHQGAYEISAARSYMHDETDYDRQYGLEQFPIDELTREAGYLMDICRKHGLAQGAPVLEIGCGTGRISVGLAMQPEMGHLLITDPSPAFCGIVQRKLVDLEVKASRVDFGILQAEDVALLPPGSVSLILLRSVLHHIADVEGFLRSCATVLPAGGLLVCEEPYYDGYVMMGFLGQFIEDTLAGTGYTCTPKEQQDLKHFVKTMQFYGRRDVDKSRDEDKHLFRPDELMVTGREMGLELSHYPNWRMTTSPEENIRNRIGYFQQFFSEYIRFCMGWTKEFSERVAAAMQKYFQFFEPLETGGNTTPACFGTFVFTKR
jgi:ubiquinone/menaquinone biosynthesis C-methylase UbiE